MISDLAIACLIFLYGVLFVGLVLVLLRKVGEVHVLVNSKMSAALAKVERLEKALVKAKDHDYDHDHDDHDDNNDNDNDE